MKRGTRTYACVDCQSEEAVHWTARERAARLRCSSCGSLRMEPKTAEGHSDLLASPPSKITASDEGGHVSISELLELVAHRNWVIRRRAVVALGELGNPGAIPAIEARCRDEKVAVSRAAEEALRKLRGAREV